MIIFIHVKAHTHLHVNGVLLHQLQLCACPCLSLRHEGRFQLGVVSDNDLQLELGPLGVPVESMREKVKL